MNSILEVLRKSPDYLEFGWTPEDGATPSTYKLYASRTPSTSSMQFLSNVNPTKMSPQIPAAIGKVYYKANIEDIRTLLVISSTHDFSDLLLYFTITYVENGVESSILLSTIVEVPPVGIGSKTGRDDPTVTRHPYVFSDDLQKWAKQAGSSRGAIITDDAIYYKTNEIQDFSYDSSGNVTAVKAYLEDATVAGSYAKLITYTYVGGRVTKITVADSTV